MPRPTFTPPDLSDAIHIRVAKSADVQRAVAVVNAAFAVETFLEGQRTDESQFTNMMRKGSFLVAEDDSGQMLAAVYIELRGDCGYFGMLAVNPSWQGSGLGRIMVEAAERYCFRHGCKRMEITVLSLRPELLPFYRKFGYREIGTEKFQPSRPLKDGAECHCVLMSKPL
jgi:GNAT superfamily N-acetyltransferase